MKRLIWPFSVALGLLAPPAQAAGAFTVFMPFGIPQFAHEAPGRGALYAGIQAAGIAGVAYSEHKLLQSSAEGDWDTYDRWIAPSAISITAFGICWFVSVVDGARLHEQQLALAARQWQRSEWQATRLSLSGPAAAPAWGATR